MKPQAQRNPDVVVIGGGIVGSSIAVRLAEVGLKVSVYDRGEPGGEASSAAAGMIAPQGEKTESEAFSALSWESHSLYPEFVSEIEDVSGQDVGYRRDGTLLVALDEQQAGELEEIRTRQPGERRQPSAETPGISRFPIERLPFADLGQRVAGLSEPVLGAQFLPADHWVDNERLTRAVIEAARRRGVVFHARRAVGTLAVHKGRLESIEAAGERVCAGEFVLAAGCWSGALAAPAGVEIPTVPCRGQMLEFELNSPLPMVVRAGHYYLVPRAANKVVVGTTAEYVGFEKAVTAEGMSSILQAALSLAPLLSEARFCRAWAGLRPDTADHLPVLGRCAVQRLTLATGHFRNGILLAPITARLIAEMIVANSAPPAIEPFRVSRFSLEATVN
ncbi:MAG TPA: glycine oxidase ThiO [Terriglobia bacterium]|nr:glycine oxidase ThiO [Terriglobia bacterium]